MTGTEPVGYFALARRNLEDGAEQRRIVTALPVSRGRLVLLAEEYDRAERAADANVPWHWFVIELAPEDVPGHPGR